MALNGYSNCVTVQMPSSVFYSPDSRDSSGSDDVARLGSLVDEEPVGFSDELIAAV